LTLIKREKTEFNMGKGLNGWRERFEESMEKGIQKRI
jgi:hypothetical protein